MTNKQTLIDQPSIQVPDDCLLQGIQFLPGEEDRLVAGTLLEQYDREGSVLLESGRGPIDRQEAVLAGGFISCLSCVELTSCDSTTRAIADELGLEISTPADFFTTVESQQARLQVIRSLITAENKELPPQRYKEVIGRVLNSELLTEVAGSVLSNDPDVIIEAAGIVDLDNYLYELLSISGLSILFSSEVRDEFISEPEYIQLVSRLMATELGRGGVPVSHIRSGLERGAPTSASWKKLTTSNVYEFRPRSGQSPNRAFGRVFGRTGDGTVDNQDLVVIHNAGSAKGGSSGGETYRRAKRANNALQNLDRVDVTESIDEAVKTNQVASMNIDKKDKK